MNRGAWWATIHGVAKLDMTEWLTFNYQNKFNDMFNLITMPRILSFQMQSLWNIMGEISCILKTLSFNTTSQFGLATFQVLGGHRATGYCVGPKLPSVAFSTISTRCHSELITLRQWHQQLSSLDISC